jgi:hypothetical protein
MTPRQFRWLAAVLYLVVGLIAFAPILHVGFMGDDWMFLDVVSKGRNALVIFAPLNARYTRPLIVLVYYLNFRHFGLWPFPAHLVVALLHVLNAWIVCMLVARIAPPPNRVMAVGAGLIFLLFAGHSEAVSWVAGMADAAIVPFLAGALLLFDRGLAASRPGRWFVAAWLVGAAGLLAKETAMLLPALAFAWGILPLNRQPWRQRLVRTAIFCAGASVVCAGYWLFREARFGSALGAYAGMGTSEGQRVAIARMFVLRTFLPPGRIAVVLWAHYFDVLLAAAVAAGAVVVAVIDRRSRAGLAFLAMALAISLAPALPLSISLVNTLTERYIYFATVFSCALVAWVIVGLVRPRSVAAALIACVAAAQWHYLARSNRGWIRGDEVFRATVSGLVALARDHGPLGPSVILLLNMPDTIDRPHVDGAGVVTALRLVQPGIPDPEGHVRVVAMHRSRTGTEEIRPVRDGRRFTVDLGDDTLVDGWMTDTADYSVVEQSPHRFAIDVKPMTRRALVAYTTAGQVRLAAEIDGVPFGFVDLPAASKDARCDDPSLRFAGWALDDRPGLQVNVEGETARQPGVWTPLGTVDWRRGRRPDVSGLYPGYPDALRAEWNFAVACDAVRSSGGAMRVRVVARDSAGQAVLLGMRTVRTP